MHFYLKKESSFCWTEGLLSFFSASELFFCHSNSQATHKDIIYNIANKLLRHIIRPSRILAGLSNVPMCHPPPTQNPTKILGLFKNRECITLSAKKCKTLS